MNDENLVSLATRSERDRKRIQSKGVKSFVEKCKKKKKEAEERKSLAEILKNVLYTGVNPAKIKKMMKEAGIKEDTNYFAALSAATILKGIEEGDINYLYKLMELLGENNKDNISYNENQSFNNLIGAIRNVRETKSKTE